MAKKSFLKRASGRYYAFHREGSCFICLDSEGDPHDRGRISGDQLTFLEKMVEETLNFEELFCENGEPEAYAEAVDLFNGGRHDEARRIRSALRFFPMANGSKFGSIVPDGDGAGQWSFTMGYEFGPATNGYRGGVHGMRLLISIFRSLNILCRAKYQGTTIPCYSVSSLRLLNRSVSATS